MDVRGRLSSLRARMCDEQVGSFVITQPVNVAYLTGFENVFDGEDAHAAVVTQDSAVIYTDSRYFDSASAAAEGSAWTVMRAAQNLYVTVCDEIVSKDDAAVALESAVPYGRFKFISERLGGNVVALDRSVERIRQIKEPAEIERIAAAQQLTDLTFDHVLGLLRIGVTEREIALELEFFMRREGSDGVAFAPIVASGPHSAFPHAAVTDRALRAGDLVKMDFGARVDGYCADMTRTVVMGQADEQQRAMHDAVRDANFAGIEAALPGVPARKVDSVARAVIEARGYGECFGHGLGHGVGMQVHEAPSVGPRASDSLPEGCVITIEPGVYIPGFGGVRIEDLIVVEHGGARVLTQSTKELLEL